MLTNKCYITAKYQEEHTNDFVEVTLNTAKYVLYIGNFDHTDKIIAKLKRNTYLNAICRIRSIYEPDYPEFNHRIDAQLHDYLTKQNLFHHAIWLEAIKVTSLPEAKLTTIAEQGYFALQDNYQTVYPHISGNKLIEAPLVTDTNKERLVTIHGTLNHSHTLTAYRILEVEGLPLESNNSEKLSIHNTIKQAPNNIPPELRKFFAPGSQ